MLAAEPFEKSAQVSTRVFVVETDIEPRLRLCRYQVGGRIADVDSGDLQVRRLEMCIARIEDMVIDGF